MDATYSNVFETLFSEFPLLHESGNPARLIPSDVVVANLREVRNQIISAVANFSNKRVRPDAKLFLISNYYHMVLLPVLLANQDLENKFPLSDDFKNRVKGDIKKILDEAAKIDSEEIT